MNQSEFASITQLLESVEVGDRDSANRLFSLVYDELKKLANRQMNSEGAGHTLQSTALVHEVWVKLIGNRDAPAFRSRDHFFSAAAQAMRRILVDSARARSRKKRGAGAKRFEVREDDLILQQDTELLALDEALDKLRALDAPKAQLVELRYFAGMTNAQASGVLGISPATGDRYWAFARAWLRSQMEDQ